MQTPQNKTAEKLQQFLHFHRVRAWLRIILLCYAVILFWWINSANGLQDSRGRPVGTDFITFYSASRLLQIGLPESLFDLQIMQKTQTLIAGHSEEIFAWHYPPPFMAVIYPLNFFSYYQSWLLWSLLTLAPFLYMVRQIHRHQLTTMLFLAAPGTFQNIIHGQNGFLTAYLLGMGVWLCETSPFYAGLCLGSLIYKPHFAILTIPALLATWNRRALAGFATSTIFWVVSTLMIFGKNSWTAFFMNLPFASQILDAGALPFYKMPTPLPGMLMLGIPTEVAKAIQLIIIAITATSIFVLWRSDATRPVKATCLLAAVFAASPFGFDYDLVILAPAAAILLASRDAINNGLVWAMIFWLLPFFAPILALVTGLPFAQAIIFCYLYLCFKSLKRHHQNEFVV